MKPQQDSGTFKPTLMLISGRALGFTATFFVPMFLTRTFSQDEFGTYKQFFLVTYTLLTIGQFGLTECLYYFLPKNPQAAGRYVLNSIVMLGLAGLTLSAGLIVYAERIAGWLNNPGLAHYIPVVGPYLFFMLTGTILEITMVIRKQYSLATATYAISDIMRALILVVSAVLTRSLEVIFLVGCVFFFLRTIATLLYLRSEFGSEIGFDKVLLREQLAYALPFALYVLVDFVYQNYHHYAVSYFFDPATFAIYSVGCLTIPLIDFIGGPAANVMMVHMGDALRDGRMGRLVEIWHETTRRLALLFFPIVALLVVNASPLIVMMFTDAYAASVPIFAVWSISFLASAFLTDSALRVFAKTRYLLLINIVRLAVTALCMVWFLSRFHLIGAVLITMVGLVISRVMAFLKLRGLMDVSLAGLLPWTNLGATFIAAALSAIPSALIVMNMRLAPVFLLPISGGVYLATYVALAWTCGLVTPAEKQSIISWFSRPIRTLTARS